MTGTLITYTQDDLSRMADKILALIASRDNVSKPMVLRTFAQGVFGPKCDWGRVTGSPEAHLYSQRARTQIEQATSTALKQITPRDIMTPHSEASYKLYVAAMLQSRRPHAALPYKDRTLALSAVKAAAKDAGYSVRVVDLADATFSPSEDLPAGAKITGLSLKTSMQPSRNPNALTVYTGLHGHTHPELSALFETCKSLPADGSAGSVLLLDDVAHTVVPDVLLNLRDHSGIFEDPAGTHVWGGEDPVTEAGEEEDMLDEYELRSLIAAHPIGATRSPEILRAGKTIPRPQKPDGRNVKVTGRARGHLLRLWLRDETGPEVSELELVLTRKEVRAIEDFIRDPGERHFNLNKMLFITRLKSQETLHMSRLSDENFRNIHVDDLLLALRPLLRLEVDVEALIAAQRHRLFNQ